MVRRLTKIARNLRKRQTPSEAKIWALLRNRRFMNVKFRRQCPIGPYIVDFCTMSYKLVVEIDGGGHDYIKQRKKDNIRDKYLRSKGYKVIRIWASELYNNLDGVMKEISRAL